MRAVALEEKAINMATEQKNEHYITEFTKNITKNEKR